ncbi:hypothetical protein BC829DRAFT_388127 [Chytridium lagenaria]|nr:hypothetical protein BC829DRAFT_388127 [Chytridium lagenaria]
MNNSQQQLTHVLDSSINNKLFFQSTYFIYSSIGSMNKAMDMDAVNVCCCTQCA